MTLDGNERRSCGAQHPSGCRILPLMTLSAAATSSKAASTHPSLAARYRRVRAFSEELCSTLETEDYVAQSMPDVSPTRWHLAHVTWFFETFVLKPCVAGYHSPNDAFEVLFNSYYNSVGEQFPRHRRGHLTRPTVREVFDYRRGVDSAMQSYLEGNALTAEQRHVVEIGLHHEQQHQELLLTDLKHVLSINPLDPIYRPHEFEAGEETTPLDFEWLTYDGGLADIGHAGDGFSYDNEGPRHTTYCEAYELADRLVTCGDWLAFIDDGGYSRPELWTSLGWSTVQSAGWRAPLYWRRDETPVGWSYFTLAGRQPVRVAEPVTHISWLEADAFARWAGARLPTETEWERAAVAEPEPTTGFADTGFPHPEPVPARQADPTLRQCIGTVWEWTASPYTPYPGYKAAEGALGEYNGKFMTQQYVLRGGSCATSRDHLRVTYRNFFPPEARWQFSGLRLAR